MTEPLHADPNRLYSTERHNAASKNVHVASVRENLELLNAQNAKIHLAVAEAIPAIEMLVSECIKRLKNGGRLFYIGAGTSGRLGVLDASEMPPTFGTGFGTPEQIVQGIIAGGDNALRNPDEIAEDSIEMGLNDTAQITDRDVLVGISASGSAVYVRAAVKAARARGVYTAAICTGKDAPLLELAECKILAPLDAEIPAGSTRMFSGTAQKMILNMITTCTMIGLGKVYGGYMVDVMINNKKLVQRAARMVVTLTGVTQERADALIAEAGAHTKNPVKQATIMALESVSYDEAVRILAAQDGRIDATMRKHGRNVVLGCE